MATFKGLLSIGLIAVIAAGLYAQQQATLPMDKIDIWPTPTDQFDAQGFLMVIDKKSVTIGEKEYKVSKDVIVIDEGDTIDFATLAAVGFCDSAGVKLNHRGEIEVIYILLLNQ